MKYFMWTFQFQSWKVVKNISNITFFTTQSFNIDSIKSPKVQSIFKSPLSPASILVAALFPKN